MWGTFPCRGPPRDVNVLVPYNQRAAAEKAITQRWPELKLTQLSQVTRFMDPSDVDLDGRPKPVVDLMLPWSPFQETIIKTYSVSDSESASRVPTIEAAVVAKYAPLVSPNRNWKKKQQDAVDLRNLVTNNIDAIDRDIVRSLADQVWDAGGQELLDFFELALHDKPFPI